MLLSGCWGNTSPYCPRTLTGLQQEALQIWSSSTKSLMCINSTGGEGLGEFGGTMCPQAYAALSGAGVGPLFTLHHWDISVTEDVSLHCVPMWNVACKSGTWSDNSDINRRRLGSRKEENRWIESKNILPECQAAPGLESEPNCDLTKFPEPESDWTLAKFRLQPDKIVSELLSEANSAMKEML